jgi:phosphoribosyl-AMP cyclohydrolase
MKKQEKKIEPDFEKGAGLVPAIVQDEKTGEVLMLAYMNREAWNRTIETGKATYWSRSRGRLWVKGEQSGHVQLVRDILIDCDEDVILLKVEQIGGAACHTGYRSCFFRRIRRNGVEIVGRKIFDPEETYK